MSTVRLILATGEALEMPSATLAHRAASRIAEARGWDPEAVRDLHLELDHVLIPDDEPVAGHDGKLATIRWGE